MQRFRAMFHVELRQFPHVAREFNLDSGDLHTRIVVPWLAGQVVALGERKWAPERARLTIYEGPQLRTEEIGMGRGWANVTRRGEDVTARILEQAKDDSGGEEQLPDFKLALLERCDAGAIELGAAVALAAQRHPLLRPSECLSLVEQAVWELLHAGSLRIVIDGTEVDRAQWQPLLLDWDTWRARGDHDVVIERIAA